MAGYYGFTLDVRVSVRVLSALDTPIFSFPDDNLSKCHGIFTKLGTCIDIKEIWFGIANGHISSNIDGVICPGHNNRGVLSFYVFICFEIVVFYICYFCTYRIRPNYRTVRLGFSKLLGTLRCDKICTYTY